MFSPLGASSLLVPAHRQGPNARMIRSIQLGDLGGVRQALNAGADPNVPTECFEGGTPLLLALKIPNRQPAWDPSIGLLLLEAGADPRTLCRQGRTPAQNAWHYSHNAPGALAMTKALIEHPLTDVCHRDRLGTAMLASGHYAPSLISTLVQRGDDPNGTVAEKGSYPSTTVLGRSVSFGVIGTSAMVNAFVLAGADVNHCPPGGEPALAFGLRNSITAVDVQALLDAGADWTWRSASGQTLLERASQALKPVIEAHVLHHTSTVSLAEKSPRSRPRL